MEVPLILVIQWQMSDFVAKIGALFMKSFKTAQENPIQ
ncbi:hypothetical protein GP5015_1286 [gamma proteobacterium HTCC5015]|nr:hypothetical protein GP5015_1286 [gamma proteobacterium HTCC5015]